MNSKKRYLTAETFGDKVNVTGTSLNWPSRRSRSGHWFLDKPLMSWCCVVIWGSICPLISVTMLRGEPILAINRPSLLSNSKLMIRLNNELFVMTSTNTF